MHEAGGTQQRAKREGDALSGNDFGLSMADSTYGSGDFNVPHNIWIHEDVVYVADRENHRVQLFDVDGKYKSTWTDFIQPTDIYIDDNDIAYVGELRDRMSIADLNGNVLSRWGRFPSQEPGQFYASHGIWAESHGDVYVGEVL
ncbi:MAG: hypothetical protein HQ477_04590 [Chloroflexi bacterium]|nr:hypothetical protein [Chloroflexota bacterium]